MPPCVGGAHPMRQRRLSGTNHPYQASPSPSPFPSRAPSPSRTCALWCSRITPPTARSLPSSRSARNPRTIPPPIVNSKSTGSQVHIHTCGGV
ncbi:hypothetical protein M3J09_005695 [Ascochyta lentis]